VQFTDLSIGANTWAWDFDGDNKVDSTLQNPMFPYKRFVYYANILPDILRGGDFATDIPPEYYGIAYKCGRQEGRLTIEDRAAIMGVIRANKLSISKAKEVVRTLAKIRSNSMLAKALDSLQNAADRRNKVWEEQGNDEPTEGETPNADV